MVITSNKKEKMVNFWEATKFWWSIYWRSCSVSFVLLFSVIAGLYFINSDRDVILTIISTFIIYLSTGGYQILTFLIFILIFCKIVRNNIKSVDIYIILWSFIWRYSILLIAIYALWFLTSYLMISLFVNLHQDFEVAIIGFGLDSLIISLAYIVVSIMLLSYICFLNRRSISILIAIYIIFALTIYILSPFLYKPDLFFVYSYPASYFDSFYNLTPIAYLITYLFVSVIAVVLTIRIYQIIFNKGLIQYSKIKNYDITGIKLGKFSI